MLDVAPELAALAGRLDHEFADPSLLERALAHRSWCAENGGRPSNERLEFLGDAVLGLCVTDYIYRSYPDFSEGDLAKMRAAIVNETVLAETAATYSLGPTLLLGNGEDQSGGREKPSILSDSFEAVIGAIYLDGGWDAALRFIIGALQDRIADAADSPGTQDYKTRLQELAARQYGDVPHYEVDDSGPDHRKSFAARVVVGNELHGSGKGRSKKQAEQQAARDAWIRLGAEDIPAGEPGVPPPGDARAPHTEGEALDG